MGATQKPRRTRRTKAEMQKYRSRQASTRKHRLKKVHRMTMEQYEAILAIQGGTCALCAKPMITKFGAVDHDHKIARESCDHPVNESCERCWRGIVHGGCNRLLGYVRDSVEMLDRMIKYLQDPPAQRIKKTSDLR